MPKKPLIILFFIIILITGCNESSNNDHDFYPSQSVSPVNIGAEENRDSDDNDFPPPSCPKEETPFEETKAIEEWNPSQYDVVRAGEFIMELKNSSGDKELSREELLSYVEEKMGITSEQTEKIFDEMMI